ncbi:MAG: acyl carrier protein [Firmicutes bacterium]|nr:acyl carrier protein [Bacillota bacterium]
MFDNEKVISIICEQMGVDEDSVDENTDITNDLGADSVDVVELLMALEDSFDIEIPDEDVEEIRTIGELCGYIEEKTEASAE